jgi:hypothetical protein
MYRTLQKGGARAVKPGLAEGLSAGRLHAHGNATQKSLSLHDLRGVEEPRLVPHFSWFLQLSTCFDDCLSISVRGTEEEHAMPALETKETQAPRSALRHRPLREAGTPGPAPLYRRASRVQSSVETQPPQTGSPVKYPHSRRRLHPLLYLGVGMIVMFALLLLLSLAVSWLSTTMDDLHYGRPRTFQVDAVVGHGDSAATPSHFLALNYNGRVEVVEFPAGDASKARIYIGPQLYGAGSDLVPVTLSFVDVSGNHQPDMLVHLHYKGWFGFSDSEQQLVYINEAGSFRPARPDELPAIERSLRRHGQ